VTEASYFKIPTLSHSSGRTDALRDKIAKFNIKYLMFAS
jgi:hypothetical protein